MNRINVQKIYTLFFLLSLPFFSGAQDYDQYQSGIIIRQEISPDQQTMMQVGKTYFRSNPYDREFSSFLLHLINDPTIINKTIHKRTDSNFFYFKGTYTNHNPFFYKAAHTDVILAETLVSSTGDSTGKIDTLLSYQLIGYTVGGKQGETDVKEEFSRFQKRIKRKFYANEPEDLKNADGLTGQIQDYFLLSHTTSALTAAWAKSSTMDEYIFAITLHIKVINNMAQLP